MAKSFLGIHESKLYAVQIGEGVTLVFLLALRIGEGELGVGEKGSADPAGRIGLARCPSPRR